MRLWSKVCRELVLVIHNTVKSIACKSQLGRLGRFICFLSCFIRLTLAVFELNDRQQFFLGMPPVIL